MKQNILNELHQAGVHFLEKLIGVTGAGSSSDLTATGTSEVETLDSIGPGDIVLCGLATVDVLTPFVLAAGTLTCKVGITGDDDRIVAATNVKDTTAKVIVPTVAADALPYVNNTASAVSLLATFTAGAGNVGDATAGQLLIRVPVIRARDRLSPAAGGQTYP